MIIRDFFSNKIHANEDWPERLCEMAHVFNRLDGQPYNRDALIREFEKWAPAHRHSPNRADAFFRDEITAYMSHLGLCRIRQENGRAVFRVSQTARAFLMSDAPNVGAFLRLQLSLMQFPILMGLQYNQGRVTHQVQNAKNVFRGMLDEGVKISPIRLLITAIKADSRIGNKGDIFAGDISINEWYCLANQIEIYREVSPNIEIVEHVLLEIRSQHREISSNFESRINLLHHTELFNTKKKGKTSYIGIREADGDADREIILRQISAIESMNHEFGEYSDDSVDGISNDAERWAKYHDAVMTLPENIVNDIASDISDISDGSPHSLEAMTFKMREFGPNIRPYTPRKWMQGDVHANPDVTRTLRERRNYVHSEMVRKMYGWLESECKAQSVGDSLHIDLWAKLPNGSSYIFEVKSGGVNVHEQVRKGVSQLYEYRYRYREEIKDPHLCMVVPQCELPHKWLPDYLCADRKINICYLGLGNEYPKFDALSQNPLTVVDE